MWASKADSDTAAVTPPDAAAARRLRRPEAYLRLGPFSVHTANVAVTVSVLLHAGLAIALLVGRPSFQPPRVAMAAGRDAPAVTMRLLTPEQLEAMTGQAAPLTPSEPVEPIDVPVDPPAPPPTQLATVEVTVDIVESAPATDSALPAPPPREGKLQSRPTPGPATPTAADAAPPSPPSETTETGEDAEPTEVNEMTESAESASSTPATASEAGVDAEPQPLDLPRPNYPMQSRRLGEQGEVVLSFTVTPAGTVTAIEVDRSPGHPRLVAAAKAALQAARFTPARRDGRAVAYRVTLPFRFRLE